MTEDTYTKNTPGMSYAYPEHLADEVRNVAHLAGLTQKEVRGILNAVISDAVATVDLRDLVAQKISKRLGVNR